MKKLLLSVVAVAMMFSLAACGSDNNQTENQSTDNQTNIEQNVTPEVKPETPEVKPEEKPETPEVKPEVKPEVPEVSYTYKEMKETMYSNASLNVRDLPTKDGKKIGSLKFAEEVKVTGQCKETNWYRIEYKGKEAYVSNDFLVKEKPVTEVEGSLEDIMGKVYGKLTEELPMLGTMEVTSENSEYYLGVKDMKMKEALVSEPMMGSYAHSIVLVRVAEDADVDAIKKDIKTNVNPRKWICVQVEPENVYVENIGHLIILIMDNDYAKDFKANFLALGK